MSSTCSARSATTSAAIRLTRVFEKPRTLRTATYRMIAIETSSSSSSSSPSGDQNAAR